MDCSPPGSSVQGIPPAEYWSGLPFPPPGYLPDPGIETASLVSPTLAGEFLPLCHLGSLTLQYCSLNRRHLLINHSTFLDVEKQVSSSNIIKKHSYLNFSNCPNNFSYNWCVQIECRQCAQITFGCLLCHLRIF